MIQILTDLAGVRDYADAEDGLAGAEIDFSFDVEGDDSQQSPVSDGLPGNPTPRPAHATGGQFHRKSIDIRFTRAQTNYLTVSRTQLMQLIGHAGLQSLFTNHNTAHAEAFGPDDEDTDLDDGYGGFGNRRPRPRGAKTKPPSVPSEEGRKLMDSGTFGTSISSQISPKMKTQLARSLMSRELGVGRVNSVTTNKLLSHVLLPSPYACHDCLS